MRRPRAPPRVSDTRRKLGIALAAAGALLVASAGAAYVRGAMAREQARTEWEIARAKAAREGVHRALDARPIHPPRKGEPIARLLIPQIALDEIVVEGVEDIQLNVGPGHLPQSVAPGARGNAVISAHRDRHFSRLDEVTVGDTITTETVDGTLQWVVVERRVVSRHARPLRDQGRTELTLTTCWPVRHFGPAPERLILSALPVGTTTVTRNTTTTAARARS